jgi:apolipoprotein D and lipocalin family protein
MTLSRLAAATLALAALSPQWPSAEGVAPVADFDARRYVGAWREVASIPAWFQRDCAAETTATYTLDPEGPALSVLNACRDVDGAMKTAEGRARFTQTPDVGALEVTFVSLLGFWVWPAAGDYVVIGLDPDYRWAAIGHPDRDYAWVLARPDTPRDEALAGAAAAYRAAGYDLCAILLSPEPGRDRTPLCELVP